MENIGTVTNRENPLFGRKIYFLNPPLTVVHNVVDELRSEEYEVYIIDNYRHAKPVLENNKDAMLFIYIDDVLNYDQWFNFIKSFYSNEILKSIFVGIISTKATFNVKERFMMDLSLPGGFIMLNEKIEFTAKKIKDILELNGAKGRRKYIRLQTKDNTAVNGYLVYKERLFNFSINDISSVGFSCTYPVDIVSIFSKNLVHPSISISLGRKTITVSAVIFDTKINDGKGTSVLLFTKEVPKETKNSIRSYIFEVMDSKHNDFIKNSIEDLTDYSEKIEEKNTAVPSYDEVADSFIGGLEELLPDFDQN